MGGKRLRTKAMRAQKVHISLLPLATLVSPILGQLQFNGGVSSSSNSNGSCCYNSQPFNNNGFNSNFQNQGGFNNQGFNQNQGFNNQNNRVCQCDYSLTFRDQNGNTHGACQRRD